MGRASVAALALMAAVASAQAQDLSASDCLFRSPANWVPTTPGGQFEVLFRFYGPEKPLFDKTWMLPDIERMAAP
jgi:hypothetical protein